MSSLWPFEFEIDQGMSDGQLEFLSAPENVAKISSVWFRFTPRLFWPSELYGMGSLLRSWLSWPKILPIPAYSDHGIQHSELVEQHELENPSRLFLTWSKWRSAPANLPPGKKVLMVPHPYAQLIKKVPSGSKYLRESALLVFMPHSLPGHSFQPYAYARYFEDVRERWHSASVIVACLSWHDIRAGLHRELRELGYPIVSAGHSLSDRFAFRLLDIVSNFTEATSYELGSQAYFCEAAGIPYSIFGDARNLPESLLTQNSDFLSERFLAHTEVFSAEPYSNREQRVELVREALSLDLDTHEVVKNTRSHLILELVRLMPYGLMKVLISLGLQVKKTLSAPLEKYLSIR